MDRQKMTEPNTTDIKLTEKRNQTQSLSHASLKNGLILATFALLSTGLIAVTHWLTKDKIALEIEAAMARGLNEIIPAENYDNNVYRDCTIVSDLELLGANNLIIYRLRQKNKSYAAFVTSIAPDGYAGKINLMVGIYHNGTIAGVRVTEHQETPGLGDKIEIKKSNWIKQFDGKSLSNTADQKWLVKKDGGDFDALTGATITPRSIIRAVHKTLIYYHQHSAQLFTATNACGKNNDS